MNEVIAHLARARLGRAKVHPNDDVNKCQSSNDTIPTALQLSAALAIEEELIPALIDLQEALAAKADAFWDVVKTGRTHLQDATPIRLGQEFAGYAGQVEEAIRRAQAARDELLDGAAGRHGGRDRDQRPPRVRGPRLCASSRQLTGLLVREAPNHFHAQASLDAAIAAHGALRAIALGLWKIANGHPPDGHGPARGARRARPARDAARLLDHAGQGEPGDRREPDDGRRARRRQRRHGRASRRPARCSSST